MLSDNASKLAERIRFNYQEKTDIEKFMDVVRAKLPNFQSISYNAVLEDNTLLEKDHLLEELAQNIGFEIAKREFSHFIYELKKVPCTTVKTTLNEIIETLEQTHDELWDLGVNIEHLFMPLVLKNEIRKRKRSIGTGITFSTRNITPNITSELGHSQIIFANKQCYRKTYPITIDEQILVSLREGMRKSEINCNIIQNLHFPNSENMRRIIVTDAESSDFLSFDR